MRLTWLAPSRDEGVSASLLHEEQPQIWMDATEAELQSDWAIAVQGGRDLGLVLHKLMEEILNGETGDTGGAIIKRTATLIEALGRVAVDDPSHGLSADELASCILRTLARYGVHVSEREESAAAGIADALMLNNEGQPAVVVDWKSDVSPDTQTVEHYRDGLIST